MIRRILVLCLFPSVLALAAQDLALWEFSGHPAGYETSFVDGVSGLNAEVLSKRTSFVSLNKNTCRGSVVFDNALSDSDENNVMLKVTDNDLLTGHQGGAGGFDSLTIEIEFKPSIIKQAQLVRKTESNISEGYQIYMTEDGNIGFMVGDDSSTGIAISRNSVEVDKWHTVIVTWENRFQNYNTQVMLDGIVTRTSTTVPTLTNTTGPLTIGGLYRGAGNYGQFFAGEIKRVVISTDKARMLDVHGKSDPLDFIMPTGEYLEHQNGYISSEFVYDIPRHPECHASTIVDLGGGQLGAAWNGGTCEGHLDFGVWFSRFNGSQWSTPVKLAQGPMLFPGRDTLLNPTLFKHSSGKVMLFYLEGTIADGVAGRLKSSDDNAFTWSNEISLPSGITGCSKNKPIELANGDILCPASGSQMEITSNFGNSWTEINVPNPGGFEGVIQPTILKHSETKLQAFYRTRESNIAQSFSYDGGLSWSGLTLINLPSNNSGFDAVTLSDGRFLLVYNHSSIPDGSWGGSRSPLNVVVSENGTDWQAALVLEDGAGEYSYPAVTQSEDGLVHIVYTWKRLRIKHVVIDPDSLSLEPINSGVWP